MSNSSELERFIGHLNTMNPHRKNHFLELILEYRTFKENELGRAMAENSNIGKMRIMDEVTCEETLSITQEQKAVDLDDPDTWPEVKLADEFLGKIDKGKNEVEVKEVTKANDNYLVYEVIKDSTKMVIMLNREDYKSLERKEIERMYDLIGKIEGMGAICKYRDFGMLPRLDIRSEDKETSPPRPINNAPADTGDINDLEWMKDASWNKKKLKVVEIAFDDVNEKEVNLVIAVLGQLNREGIRWRYQEEGGKDGK